MSTKKQPALIFIFITILIDVIGLGIIIPVLPQLIHEVTGMGLSEGAAMGGWLVVAFSVMQFIFSPLLGNLSDRYGRRPILLLSLLGFTIDYVLLVFAPNLTWLFVGRIIAGFMGASFTTASAYIADISSDENRSQNFGMLGAAFGLGFIIGPTIGGLLGELGTRVPFMAAAALTFLNAVYGYFVLPESLPIDKRRPFDWSRCLPWGAWGHIKKHPVVYGLVGAMILIYVASHAVQSNWSFYTQLKFAWSESTIGFSLGIAGVLVALVQGFLIRIVNPKIGNNNSVYLGITFSTLGLLLFGLAAQGWHLYLILIPYCLGGLSGPALQSIISAQFPANEQGELQGALTSLISVTSIIGPALMTQVFEYFTSPQYPIYFPGAPFILGALITFTGGLLAFRALRRYNR